MKRAGNTAPAPIVVGSDDDRAAPGANAQPITKAIPNAKLDILRKFTHYSFPPSRNEKGKQYVKAVCTDPAGVDRDALHQQVTARAPEFFTRTLPASP